MAQSTSKLFYDERAIGNKEDLSEEITMITPTDTPFLSRFGKVKAKSVVHDWLTDTLADAAESKHIEGADYSFSKPASRTRLSNYTQIVVTPVEVSDTQRSVDTAGIEDEFAYQLNKKMKEHARNIEYSLVNGTGNSGASGAAREVKGVLSWITANVGTGTGTGAEYLTETMFNNLLQEIWEQGGEPDEAYANGFQKRKISDFTGGATKNVDAEDKRLTRGVDIYESDFGVIKIIPHRYMTSTVVAVLQSNLWKYAALRPTKKVDVAKVGSGTRAVVETEFTLEARNEAGSGKITGLKTS